MHFKTLVPAVALAVALSGCTTNPYTGESQTSKGAWGALAGAAAGAAVGAPPVVRTVLPVRNACFILA